MWKVRYLNDERELVETQFDGELADLVKHDFGGPVMVIQRDRAPVAQAVDEAKGADSVSVDKA